MKTIVFFYGDGESVAGTCPFSIYSDSVFKFIEDQKNNQEGFLPGSR